MIVSITVQVRRVSGTESLRYSLTNQKPPSLTWEQISEPAPIATTRSSRLTGWLRTIGARIPAAVVIPTVADPVATRTSAATNQPSNSGDNCVPAALLLRTSATPLATRTLLNPPPAPTTNKIFAVGPTQSSVNLR